ncbi:MAG: aspartate carbamoyltransferase catalytic subunit [Pseudomonadota bacterium]
MSTLQTKHLTGIKDLSDQDIDLILARVSDMKAGKQSDSLKGKNILSLFYENSTRTRISFEIATNRLGGNYVSWNAKSSSVTKGETLRDTILTFNAMKPDAIIVRHEEFGAPHYISTIAECPVINAGDSWNEHPTQAFLDAFTLQEAVGDLKDKTIAICGDIAHSRVANSAILLLSKLGMNIHIVAPPALMPEKFPIKDISTFENLEEGIKDCDAVMMLRNQMERMEAGLIESNEAFFAEYGLTKEKLKAAKEGTVVLHPGPMNRNVEIADEVADDPNVPLILKQVENGVYVRMAILDLLVNGK